MALFAAAPSSSLAQDLDIQPISLDVSSETDQLVLAALPVGDVMPIIRGVTADETPVVRAAVRPSDQLPTPSIILGYIAPEQEEEFGLDRLLPATVEQISFALDDLEAREALRARDADLFKRFVEEGHLDPDPAQLNRTLQAELLRMRCYRSSIDGQWGRGSRRSVTSYFNELDGVSWPDQNPSNELFRAILINGDVVCAAAPSNRTVRTNTSTSSRSSSSSTRTRTPAPAPAPQPAPAQKPAATIELGPSIGVFR
ncbi:MAG: hypothetical protein GJ676_08780 [Rhodobacteraceae bacterium]|nr:hypothetical protein [Paracoccaceae bacterium]